MTKHGLAHHDGLGVRVEIDVNQPELGEDECKDAGRVPLGGWCTSTVRDGPVESVVSEGPGNLPNGTRLFGRLWTGGETVVGRYTRARRPNGDEFEVCISLSLNGGAEKVAGSKPGAALVWARQEARILFGQWPEHGRKAP